MRQEQKESNRVRVESLRSQRCFGETGLGQSGSVEPLEQHRESVMELAAGVGKAAPVAEAARAVRAARAALVAAVIAA